MMRGQGNLREKRKRSEKKRESVMEGATGGRGVAVAKVHSIPGWNHHYYEQWWQSLAITLAIHCHKQNIFPACPACQGIRRAGSCMLNVSSLLSPSLSWRPIRYSLGSCFIIRGRDLSIDPVCDQYGLSQLPLLVLFILPSPLASFIPKCERDQ